MRKLPLVLSAFAGGAIVALALVIGNLVDIKIEIRRAPAGSAQKPAVASPAPQSTDPSEDQSFVASPSEPRRLVESASKLTSAGQLREAQERYLQVLLINPDDQDAMRGLVRVRRLMAGNDARALRRQAATYRRALSQGKETGEHYTAVAMDLLAVASLQAAAELEDSSARVRPAVTKPMTPVLKPTTASKVEAPRPKPQPTSVAARLRAQSKPKEVVRPSEEHRQVPAPAPAAPKPVEKPSSRPAPAPKPVQKPPSPVAAKPMQKPPSPAAPSATLTVDPEPPVDMDEPFVTITVGPIASWAQASSITTELTVAGYVARMRRDGAHYFITLGPYRQSVGERIASRIKARFGQGAPVSLNPSAN